VVRKTSKLPESRAIAEVADVPSISGAVTLAQAKLAAPTSNKVKPRSLYMIYPPIHFELPYTHTLTLAEYWIHFLLRARRISKPPESRTIADAAEAPSISGVTVPPANAKLAVPTIKKLKPINFNTSSSSSWIRSVRTPDCLYFLRRARRTSKPPESSTTAAAADAPSISGATVVPANAKFATPTIKKLKPINFDTCSSSDWILSACSHRLRLFLAAGPQNQQTARKQDHGWHCRGAIDFRRGDRCSKGGTGSPR
jgi:hypothetical protein